MRGWKGGGGWLGSLDSLSNSFKGGESTLSVIAIDCSKTLPFRQTDSGKPIPTEMFAFLHILKTVCDPPSPQIYTIMYS